MESICSRCKGIDKTCYICKCKYYSTTVKNILVLMSYTEMYRKSDFNKWVDLAKAICCEFKLEEDK